MDAKDLPWFLPALALLLGLLGYLHVRLTRAAREVAQRYGLSFRGKIMGFRMTGTVRGVPVDYFTEMGSSGSGSSLVFRANLSGVVPPALVFAKDYGPHYPGYPTGVPALDDGYKLYAPDRDAAMSFVRTPAVRDALTGLVLTYQVHLYHGQLEVRAPQPTKGEQMIVVDTMLDESLAATVAMAEAGSSQASGGDVPPGVAT